MCEGGAYLQDTKVYENGTGTTFAPTVNVSSLI